jgi:hypothetical protein
MVPFTQNELRSWLYYDPTNGVFTWRLGLANCTVCGEVAGSYDAHGYLRIGIKYKMYKSHRLAWYYMYGEWPTGIIDHINRIKDDNRISNLRIVTATENSRNQGIQKNNTSGIPGVYFNKTTKKWRVFIYNKSQQIALGSFDCKLKAIEVRQKAEVKFGYTPKEQVS